MLYKVLMLDRLLDYLILQKGGETFYILKTLNVAIETTRICEPQQECRPLYKQQRQNKI